MSIKYFLLLTITSACVSVVQASERMSFQEPISSSASSRFSWTGFYVGGQISNFSSTVAAKALDLEIPLLDDRSKTNKWHKVDPVFLPKPLGIRGGIYTGLNIDIGNGLIVGVDTDITWSGKEDSRNIIIDNGNMPMYKHRELNGSGRVIFNPLGSFRNKSAMYNHIAKIDNTEGDVSIFNHTLKEKWTGATRVRIGFAADHIMPYIAAGVSYVELKDTLSVSLVTQESEITEKKKMVGYTVGGGIDIAMIGNVVMRAEYRYSDFGKKEFAKGEVELSYKTNDFRVGVAYKF
ncbi:outer membrane protein [Bartonella bilalgolemii]|uniref:Porin family protein n=1 Tax=Bartonella bilalgolemii TaxID=2942911 RepID=A0ABT0P9B5_9HYPH|nr:outer membrane protein [Bartonella sp. G70]MCL6229929.1 porin family protein [Bartonella sp. G70]